MGISASSDVALKRGGGSTQLKRPVLSEDDAWDIALTWRDQLRGCVRLETATQRLSSSIIPTFEWVTFVFNGSLLVEEGLAHVRDPHKTAAYARAATIAWFALSCCEGYSGKENPQFWRRVFVELLYTKSLPRPSKRVSHPKRGQLPISDAVRFFHDPYKPFPRIKLVVGAADDTTTTELVFLGREVRRGKVRDAQLQRILTTLQPFIRRSHWTRRVPVQVSDLPTVAKAEALLQDAFPGTSEVEPEPAEPTTDSMGFPQIYLQSVSFMRLTSSSIKSLYEQLPSCDVEVELTLGLWNIVHHHRLCDGLLPQTDTKAADETRPRWRVVQLFMMQSTDLSYSHLGVLCSALPHLQSVTTMTLPPTRYSHGTPSSVASDWAWLGYAIFHPDAASQSSFMSLEIDLGATSSDELAAFQRMKVGNNLVGGETSSEYLEGRVRKFSAVWRKPNDAQRIHTISTQTWVGVCVQAASALESQGWVCAVVPGYGSGWMRSRDILEIRRRPPGKSCIRTLCVNMGRGSVAKPKLALLLTSLGDRVTSLSLNFSEIMSASTLQRVLALCPSLKSLRVYHDGSCWADEQLSMELPRLEELSLSIDALGGPLMPLQELKPACLPRLKALKVISSHADSFKHHESIIVSFLASQRVLQYLHWSGGRDLYPTWADTLHDRTTEATRKFLHEVPEADYISHGPLHLSCRLAFLSVIHREAGRSGVGKLGDELAAHIFQYATSTTPREISTLNPFLRNRGHVGLTSPIPDNGKFVDATSDHQRHGHAGGEVPIGMGRSRSSMLEGSLSSVLTEQDAWAIAMAWRDELRGCVRLETDPADGDLHMVESVGWLTFVFKGRLTDGLRDVENPPETAAFARAASIAWLALSCCKGYGADENPLFWRRVLTEYVAPLYAKDEIVPLVNNPYRPQAPITDAVRFFSRHKNGFPRVMLVPKLEWETQCIDVFLGRVTISNPSRDRQLERILTKLKPFINARLWSRHLDVALDEVPVSRILSLSSKPEEELAPDHQHGDSQHVEMRLHSVFVSARDLCNLNDANRHELLRADFDVVVNPCSVDQLVESRKLRDYVSALIAPPCEPRKPRLRFPLVQLSEALGSSSNDTEVLCSALRRLQHITAVQATCADYLTHSRVGSSDVDWGWLGYAIFHPDAEAMSAFTTLDIRLNGVGEAQIQKLEAMATGNNLVYAISGDETLKSTAYYQAQVRGMTKVRAQDNDSARVVHQFNETAWVDVCVSTADISALEEYTRAVIPRIGFGWILSADITKVTSRSAGASSLRALRVTTRHHWDGFNRLLWLLSAIGNSLTYLDVMDHIPLQLTHVQQILCRCPALKSLRILHDGSYWAATDDITEADQPFSVHLEELELRIDTVGFETPTLHALDTSLLPNLKVLRVKTRVPDSLESNHGTVQSILESHESLRYFHWCGSQQTSDERWPISYDERRKRAVAFQGADEGHPRREPCATYYGVPTGVPQCHSFQGRRRKPIAFEAVWSRYRAPYHELRIQHHNSRILDYRLRP